MDRNTLIESHLRFASIAASKFTLGARRETPAWEDAYSTACIALVEAADAYDPSRGAKFLTFAWPRMKRAIQELRRVEMLGWERESLARHALEEDGRDHVAEADEFRAGLSVTPEDLLLEGGDRHRGAELLERLPAREREIVETVLADRPLHGGRPGTQVVRIAAAAGLHVSPPKESFDFSAHRCQRWYRRLTPEQREERLRVKREAYRRAHPDAKPRKRRSSY